MPVKLRQVVHRHEAVFQPGDQGQQEGRQDPVVGAAPGDGRAEGQAVDAAERMIRDGDETALRGNTVQVFRGDVVGDAHFFEHAVCEIRPGDAAEFPLHRVDPVQVQQPVGGAGEQPSGQAIDLHGFLQVFR